MFLMELGELLYIDGFKFVLLYSVLTQHRTKKHLKNSTIYNYSYFFISDINDHPSLTLKRVSTILTTVTCITNFNQ